VTLSNWLDFGRPAPPGRGLRRGENVWLRQRAVFADCRRFYSLMLIADANAEFSTEHKSKHQFEAEVNLNNPALIQSYPMDLDRQICLNSRVQL